MLRDGRGDEAPASVVHNPAAKGPYPVDQPGGLRLGIDIAAAGDGQTDTLRDAPPLAQPGQGRDLGQREMRIAQRHHVHMALVRGIHLGPGVGQVLQRHRDDPHPVA